MLVRRFLLALLALVVFLPSCADETDTTVRNMKLPQGLNEDPDDRCGPLEKDGKYIEDAIMSAINQSYPKKQIIIYDDCSHD
ncbi:MAG: hypothetical protein CL407_03225, partial [Acidimicrobiaceae bacterium]|nr:hypothetical protein [Acidimicrobiaceae bacterium]